MKSFPYKILFLCIFLPPVLYVFSLNGLEFFLQRQIEGKIDSIIIQKETELLEGRHTVKEEINRNMSEYLAARSFWYKAGISSSIIVKTSSNKILYPSQLSEVSDDYHKSVSAESPNYMDVAADNFKILNDRLIKLIEVRIRQNSWLANSILIFYILIALLILRFSIKKSLKSSEEQEEEQKKIIGELSEKLETYESELSSIKEKEKKYSESISELNKEKENLSSDIDELLDEMEKLEDGLTEQKELREKRENEINSLREEIENIKLKSEKPKKKNKKQESLEKRFRVLYKNLIFTEKAIEGFIPLSEEFQLKAEEIIHRINEDNSNVSVKRKVFSKGGKINVLEIDFAYSGRIYYQKDNTKSIIVAIGTKKTQSQDLAYLEREYS